MQLQPAGDKILIPQSNEPSTGAIVHEPRSSGPARHLGALFVAVIAAVVLFYRFRYSAGFLAFYEDDFFYYLKVAKNLATTGVSTFDGTHLTNGYHPLWLLTLTAMYRLASARSFYYLLASFSFASTMSMYVLSRRCLLRGTRNTLYADICALVLSMYALILMRGGMEVTLTFPIALLFLSYRLRPDFTWTRKQALMLGFLGSLLVLSRLDSGLLVALVFICDAVSERPPLKSLAIRALTYAAGAWLVGVYLAVNQAIFGTLMPVSGQAKELRLHHLPSLTPLRSIVYPPTLGRLLIAAPSLLVFVAVLFGLLGKNRESIRPRRSVLWAIALFPVVHLALLSIISDWPLWGWYLYPLVLLMFAGSLVWAGWAQERLAGKRTRGFLTILAVFVCLFWIAYTAKSFALRKPESNELYPASRQIEAFASTHPGRYAMGDRSGLPGFLIHEPMIQLEGLMMDKQYLSYIRRQATLNEVLNAYSARYYIAANQGKTLGCYTVREPAQAGPDSASMAGRLCMEPVARYTNNNFETMIYDLTPGR